MVDVSFILKKIDNGRKTIGLASVSQIILSYLGIWPKNYEKLTLIRCVITALLLPLWFATTSAFHLHYAINLHPFEFKKCVVDVCSLMGAPVCQYVLVMFILNHKEIVEIMKTLGKLVDQVHEIAVMDNILNFIVYIYLICIGFVGLISYIVKLLEVCSDDDDTTCGLLLTARLPGINLNASPYRQINFTMQITLAYVVGIITFFSKWVILSESEYLCCLLRHLKKEMMLIPTLEGRDARKRHIKKCVSFHHLIIGLWEKYINATSNMYFPHLFATGMNMSILALVLLIEFQFSMLLNFFMWWSNALVCCLFGERLQNESESLSEVAYNSIPWDGDNETVRDLLLIMIRSQKPLYIPAGKFGILNLIHFMSIMKTTYSFLTLMVNFV